jgi:integrase
VAEVQALLASVEPQYQLMVKLLYGAGLRLNELLRLRVKDLDFDAGLIVVRGGKGDRDRTTLLPTSLHLDDLDARHANYAPQEHAPPTRLSESALTAP